jgi:hypothetical protein
MSRLKSLANRVKWVLGPLASLYLGLNIPTIVHDIDTVVNPSAERKTFKSDFGITVLGQKEEIENRPLELFWLYSVLHQERVEADFSLTTVRFLSDNPLKNSMLNQLQAVGANGFGGYCIPGQLGLKKGLRKSGIHHEVKHAKTYQALTKDFEFLAKWEAISTDEDGNSPYLPGADRWLYQVRGLHHLVVSKNDKHFEKNSSENEEEGFVTDYARISPLEDIAELGEAVEEADDSDRWYNRLHNPETRNIRFIAKVELAQEGNIIPKEFSEWVALENLYRSSWRCYHNGCTGDKENNQAFREAATQFLEDYPDSIYTSELLYHIAWQQENQGDHFKPDEKGGAALDVLIGMYTKGLNVDHKDLYILHLTHIRDLYSFKDDKSTQNMLTEALNLYGVRMATHNPLVVTEGVNDFLREQGFL